MGIGITAFGAALFFNDAWHDTGQAHQASTFFGAMLTLLWKAIWWPLWAAGPLLNSILVVTVLLVATAFFWGTVVYCFIEVNKRTKASQQILKG